MASSQALDAHWVVTSGILLALSWKDLPPSTIRQAFLLNKMFCFRNDSYTSLQGGKSSSKTIDNHQNTEIKLLYS